MAFCTHFCSVYKNVTSPVSVCLPAANQMASAELSYKIRYILLPVYTVAMTFKMMCKSCSTLCSCHLDSCSKCFLSDYRNIIEVHNLNVVRSLKAMLWLRWLVTWVSL
jgi:hypothetical protein